MHKMSVGRTLHGHFTCKIYSSKLPANQSALKACTVPPQPSKSTRPLPFRVATAISPGIHAAGRPNHSPSMSFSRASCWMRKPKVPWTVICCGVLPPRAFATFEKICVSTWKVEWKNARGTCVPQLETTSQENISLWISVEKVLQSTISSTFRLHNGKRRV